MLAGLAGMSSCTGERGGRPSHGTEVLVKESAILPLLAQCHELAMTGFSFDFGMFDTRHLRPQEK